MRHAKRTMLWTMSAAGMAFMIAPAFADDAKSSFPAMAPIAQYHMASADEEAALARSAAPPSISTNADILVLGAHGYETTTKGKNGFVCLVQRLLLDRGLQRSGILEPQDSCTYLPQCHRSAERAASYSRTRTQWVLADVSRATMLERTKAQIAAKTYAMPEIGAMSYMMSKGQYLSDAGGHWHPHLMFYVPTAAATTWGANLPGSPVFAGDGDPEPVTVFFVPVMKWSDGTPQTMDMK